MHHGAHSSVAVPATSAPVADMDRLPSLAAPSEPHSYFNWSPYRPPDVDSLRPQIAPQPNHSRPSDGYPGGQKLPSLRTLLEPQLLDPAPLDPSPTVDGRRLPAPSRAYGSASPTLKRRFETDYFGHDRNGDDGRSSRAPPVLHTSSQYATVPNPNSSSRPTFLQHPRQNLSDPVQKIQRSPSSASGFSGSPTSVTPVSMPAPPDESSEHTSGLPRQRYDSAHRAPTRSSRCIGQREIPGEGMCYVYEDGSFCRVVIDGEPVNPSWGITKAGKPRKRLAQACLTCREKKIKCEPAIPKCHQCTKSQRVCRGGLSQISSQDEQSPSSTLSMLPTPKPEHISPVSAKNNAEFERILSIQPPLKAPRIADDSNSPVWGSDFHKDLHPNSATTEGSFALHPFNADRKGPKSDSTASSGNGLLMEDQLDSNWEQDPFETDQRLTTSLLSLYFTHVGCATYCIFPRKQFTSWVETCRNKSPSDRMLLYTVLAMGSIFSPDNAQRAVGKRFAEVAAYAARKRFGKFSLQLCQTRLMLALFYFCRGKPAEAWDMCGASLRVISALNLNTEEGVKDFSDEDLDYGFDRPTLEECRRRTFWSGFLMDRYNGFCGGTLCFLHPEDTFLRLPGLDKDYGSPFPREAPLFDIELLEESQLNIPLGTMAHLTLISAVWGEVLLYTSRGIHRPDHSYSQRYEEFYNLTYQRLDGWRNNLPSHLRFTPSNLDDSIAGHYPGTFMSLHALYHATQIRLNRYVRTSSLSTSNLRRNIFRANQSAKEFIGTMQAIAPATRADRRPNAFPDFVFSTPFSGYALMLAVDTISAGGAIAALPALMQSISTSLPALTELASFWASAKAQHKAISLRLKHLAEIALSEQDRARSGPFWRLSGSLDTSFGRRDDLMYGIDDRAFFDVMNEEA